MRFSCQAAFRLPPVSVRMRGGVTLIELLVVFVIVSILATLAIAVIGNAREQGERAVCTSNLRQIMAATMMYMSDNDGVLPLVHKNAEGDYSRWAPQLQRYFGDNWTGTKLASNVFVCPADTVPRIGSGGASPCSYGLNRHVHINGDAENSTRRPFTIIQDPARTILYGEVWNEMNTVLFSLSTGAGESFLGDFHEQNGSHYAFADGHIAFMTKAEVMKDNSYKVRNIR